MGAVSRAFGGGASKRSYAKQYIRKNPDRSRLNSLELGVSFHKLPSTTVAVCFMQCLAMIIYIATALYIASIYVHPYVCMVTSATCTNQDYPGLQ